MRLAHQLKYEGVDTLLPTSSVCRALHRAGLIEEKAPPEEILTDGMVFTNRFGLTPTKVLFDRICRDNVINYLLTALATPTRNGKIECFHRTLHQSSSPRGFLSRSQQRSASSAPESRTTTSGHRVPLPP